MANIPRDMTFDFAGRRVLLLGGIHAISIGVAEAFARTGAELAITYAAEREAPRLPGHLAEATLLPVDLQSPTQLAQQLAALAFDTAVISPAWFAHMAFIDGEETAVYRAIDDAFASNFAATTFAAQAAAKHMITNEQAGNIVFLSSVVNKIPMVNTNIVGTSLAALDVVARMAAVDLAPHNIRVNTVAAGWIKGAWSGSVLTEEHTMHTPSDIPMQHAGAPADIGNACCFLASSMASYITGSTITVDGGFSLTKSAAPSPYKHG